MITMKRIASVVLIGVMIYVPLAAQLNANQHPPGLHWKKIRTAYFDIIVPDEMLSEGQRVANTLEYLRPSLEKTMDTRLHKWTLVLNSRSSETNGWVGYLPRMSEWYPVGAQDEFGGLLDWYQMLAVHEGRHMVQFNAFDRGFNRLAGICFGDLGLGAFTFFGTPLWFIEGDAVAMETALSNSGRGRQPIFERGIRTLLLSGQPYSYYKAYLGSYQDYFPDYYALGYQMVTHTRRKYGADVWSQVIQRSSKYSYWPWSFSRSLKKVTGRNSRQIYDDTMQELKSLWTRQINGLIETPVTRINQQPRKTWTNYKFPHEISDGSVIALKTGMDDPYTLVRIMSNGKEKRLIQIGYTESISVSNDKICWSEKSPDPRWWAQSFSDIVVYDIQAKKRHRLTEKSPYFAPALSPDGKRIVAVKIEPDRHCSLVLLRASNGKKIREFPNADNYFLKTPAWSEDGRNVVFIRQKNGLRSLSILNVITGQINDVITESSEDITYPVFYGENILYDSPWSGIDHIYAVGVKSGQKYRVVARKFGAYYPNPAGDRILFCDYQVKGLNIASTALDTSSWEPIEEVRKRNVDYYQPLVIQEQGRNILNAEEIPRKQYPVQDYSPLKNSLNVHSWYVFPLPPSVVYGFLSDDFLNTLSLGTFVTYHAGENVNSYSLRASYAGIRPIIDTEIGFGKRAATCHTHGIDTTDVWDETKASVVLRFPELQTFGARSMFLQYQLNAGLIKVSNKESFNSTEPGNGLFKTVTSTIDFSTMLRKAYRDIYPRYGTAFQINYSLAMSDRRNRVSSDVRFASVQQYLPGVFKHHSLRARAALELREYGDRYQFQSGMPLIRGYHGTPGVLGSLDYSLPLFYPDFALGSFLFFKRIRANLFYDYGLVDHRHVNDFQEYRSCGTELTVDFTPLTLFYLELNAGIRYSYRIEDGDRMIELIIEDIGF